MFDPMTTTRWLNKREDLAWRGYRRMRALLDLQITRDLWRDSSLSDADYDVLSTLTEIEGQTWRSTDLARHLLWSTSRLSHQVARMERRGLVARGDCADDGRGATLSLTPAGLAALRGAAPRHLASVRRNFLDILTAAEIESLAAIAAKVIAHLGNDQGVNL